MSTLLKNLKIDYWYKAVLIIGVTFLTISLTVNLKDVNNNAIQLLSLSCIFIGLGEWINHPLRTGIMTPSRNFPVAGKVSGYPRHNCLLGIFFDILGFILILTGIIKLFK